MLPRAIVRALWVGKGPLGTAGPSRAGNTTGWRSSASLRMPSEARLSTFVAARSARNYTKLTSQFPSCAMIDLETSGRARGIQAQQIYNLWRKSGVGIKTGTQTRSACTQAENLARPGESAANSAMDPAEKVQRFEVRITTGNRRGASTTAAVYVRLVGRSARTQRLEINGEFTRDTTVVATIEVPVSLGRIRIVEVGHDNIGEIGVGWYLESVELVELTPEHPKDAQQTLIFPVRRWLGKSDIGAGRYPTFVQLRVGIADSMTDPTSFMLPGAQLVSGIKSVPVFVKCGTAAWPHPDKVRDGERAIVRPDIGQAGEDAYSVATVRTPDRAALEKLGKFEQGALKKSKLPTTVTISVCDGVYQWRDKGIDAGEWSRFLVRSLLHQAQHHVRDPHAQDSLQSQRWAETFRDLGLEPPFVPIAHPATMLQAAEERIRETDIQGSSTAVVASLHGINNMMYVACLGDSGVLVHRNRMGVIFRTPEQEHSFGYPYQLGHHEVSDHAKDALISHCRLTVGDTVVVASDGLFDNLSESQIAKIVDKHFPSRNAQMCAIALASQAYENSVSKTATTPYSEAAAEEFNLVWHGGKKDDISVVVAFIVDH